MPNTTQTIGPLVGGVSQAPSHMRAGEYATELVNALAHPALGTTKRPGTRHIAKLANSSDAHYDAASIFSFNAGDKRRYFVSVSSGQLRVVEADTGVERTVTAAPGALAYLAGLLDTERPFEAVASGDHLYVANRARVVKKDTATAAPARVPEALIAVRAADFGTTYTVKLDGTVASYRTPEGTSANARSLIGTDAVAANIASALRAQPGRSAFDITQSGSVLYVRRLDGGNFTLSSGDGLADAGLTVVFGQVKSAIDLPETGVVDGFTVRVQGDPRTASDDFWLTWKAGVWQECARPGSLVGLDASTLPHALTLGGALHDGLIVPDAPVAPSTDQAGGAPIPLTWEPGPVAVSASRLQLQTQGGYGDFLVKPGDGTLGRVVLRYDMDTTKLATWYSATVQLFLVTGVATETLIASSTPYVLDQTTPNPLPKTGLSLAVVRAWGANDRVRVRLTLDELATPANEGNDIATFTAVAVGEDKGANGGIYFTSASSSSVNFASDAIYPATASVTVTADGVSATVVAPDAGYTSAQLATAIAAAWPAGTVTCADGGNGRLLIRNTATGTAPVVSATVTMDTATTLWVPGGGLVAGALVGLRFLNLTTGGAGVVTANTAGTVSTSALSGGSTSALRPGDYIRIASAQDSFAFTPVAWESRTAGDDESNPFPSFVGRTISNIFVVQNRLAFTSGENSIASGSGKFGRFFRTSIQQVLDSDPIDVRGTASRGLPFWHEVDWNGAPHLINGNDIYMLAGDPLTPRTVGLPHVFHVSSDEACKPVVAGRRLYIARYKNRCTQLLALEAVGQGVGVDSFDTTSDVPEYLAGYPVALAADADAPIVLITEEPNGTRHLYAMQPLSVGRGTVFAWVTWQLDATAKPLAATMEGGDVVLVIKRPDGVYLESIDTLAHLK